MSLGDKIRSMTDEEIASAFWWYNINCITSFFSHGGEKMKDAAQVKDWVKAEYDPNDKWLKGPEEAKEEE